MLLCIVGILVVVVVDLQHFRMALVGTPGLCVLCIITDCWNVKTRLFGTKGEMVHIHYEWCIPMLNGICFHGACGRDFVLYGVAPVYNLVKFGSTCYGQLWESRS